MRSMKSLVVSGICVVLLAAVPGAVNAQDDSSDDDSSDDNSSTVGYYDMAAGIGQASQVPPITAVGVGGIPVQITVPNAAELAGLDVLWVLNPINGGYGGEYVANLADIQAAVSAGLVLIIHDRHVATAETILPGGALFNIIRDLNFVDAKNESSPFLVETLRDS